MKNLSKISNGVKKNSSKKTIKNRKTKEMNQTTIKETSDVKLGKKRELAELDRVAKMLIKRDFELSKMQERREKELKELDRIAKMLVRRDLQLSEIRGEREQEFQELQKKTKDLEDSRKALMNILDDAEEARALIEEERDKTLAIITNFADGLLLFDKENKLSLINPKAEEFFGVKGEDLTKKHILELGQTKALKPLVRLLGKQIQRVFRRELRIRKNLVLELSTVQVTRRKEKLGTLVTLHDITREKMIERMKTEFVSLAAHQLRTPLSAIKWTLRMILDGDLGQITEEQRDFLGKTYQSNERMIVLVNDLLDVTRIEEGRYLYKPTLTHFEDIAKFVLNSYKEQLKKRKIKLEFKKPKKKLPRTKVDVEKIRLAMQNLLDNAIRYTPPGGKVTVALKYVKKEIEVAVQDTGIGIPKDQQARIFSKFFRGTNAVRKETEGSGLGLFITKNIVEAHGGKIWFTSETNKGTTFYFTLPAQEEFETFIKGF